jgi:hypothetical protein
MVSQGGSIFGVDMRGPLLVDINVIGIASHWQWA